MKSYSLDYIDDLYVQYVRDPASVSENWRKYFEQFLVGSGSTDKNRPPSEGGSGKTSGNEKGLRSKNDSTAQNLWLARIQDRVNNLVREYRVRGHLVANLDPLGFDRPDSPELNPNVYGLNQEDLSRPFNGDSVETELGGTIDAILTRLRNTYCRSIGAQFMHIDRRNIRDWLQRRMETTENQ